MSDFIRASLRNQFTNILYIKPEKHHLFAEIQVINTDFKVRNFERRLQKKYISHQLLPSCAEIVRTIVITVGVEVADKS